MSKPPMVRDLVLLAAVALLVRGLAAALVPWPPYTDPAYYTMVAEQLASGQGFTAPAMWSFLEVGSRIPPDPGLPVPSNGHWMPLSSIIAAGAMALGGSHWWIGQLPMIGLSALLVVITYLVGWEIWCERRVALGAAILALFAGPLLIMYPLIENFAVFGVAGAAALYASMRAVDAQRPAWWLLAAGLCAGLATLARIDGVLLAVAPATAWFMRLRSWSPARAFVAGLSSAAAFAFVMAPWLLRNAATFGTPLPSAGGHTLWIRSYNEQFSIGHDVTAAAYLAAGPGTIVGDRVMAAVELAGRTTILLGGIWVLFFAAGLWQERGRPRLRPFLVYFAAMFAAMILVFTLHAPKGAFYHSAPAWLPFAFPLSVAALPRASISAGRVWPFLRRPATHRFLLVVGLLGAAALSVVGSAMLWRQWERSHRQDLAAVAFLEDAEVGDEVVMSDDPVALWNAGRIVGVPIPFDPYPVIEKVVRSYGVQWLVVTQREGAPDPLGLWNGGDSIDGLGNRASFLPADPAFEIDGVRVYEVVP